MKPIGQQQTCRASNWRWYEKGKILIFVHTQYKCDALCNNLVRYGNPCESLHGEKDQTGSESTLADFKSNVCSIFIATNIASRGLDVKDLELVVNFDVPSHYEDHVKMQDMEWILVKP